MRANLSHQGLVFHVTPWTNTRRGSYQTSTEAHKQSCRHLSAESKTGSGLYVTDQTFALSWVAESGETEYGNWMWVEKKTKRIQSTATVNVEKV